MPENETLEPAASEIVSEQPAQEQAVTSSTVEEVAPSQPEETVVPRLYAGKYKTVEELEAAYQSTSSESTRMAQQLASKPKEPASETPKYSAQQLESWKEDRFLEVSQFQALAHKAYEAGNVTDARQYEGQAKESARQIRMIDAELRRMDIASTLESTNRKSAEGRLLNEAAGVLRQYQSELVPGTELHAKASEFMTGYQAMGLDVESPLVQAQAVSLAAQLLGLSSKKVEQSTRKELTKTITQALKQGVQAGGGKAMSGGGAQPDFMKMTDAEFVAYKRQRGWD